MTNESMMKELYRIPFGDTDSPTGYAQQLYDCMIDARLPVDVVWQQDENKLYAPADSPLFAKDEYGLPIVDFDERWHGIMEDVYREFCEISTVMDFHKAALKYNLEFYQVFHRDAGARNIYSASLVLKDDGCVYRVEDDVHTEEDGYQWEGDVEKYLENLLEDGQKIIGPYRTSLDWGEITDVEHYAILAIDGEPRTIFFTCPVRDALQEG